MGAGRVGLVVIDRVRHAWITALGLTGLDWCFAFGMVAFAMIIAGLRLRRARVGEEVTGT